MAEETIYSFSRLDNFNNCPRCYYYTYIKKINSGDSIYTFMGTVIHELTQAIIQEQETNESALKKFYEAIDDAEMLGLEWMSDNVKKNYIECIIHFFENYNPIKNDTIKIEDYFEVEILGIKLKGYIDLWYKLDDVIYIIDLKTSSKFSKKDFPKKSRQLILYAMAIQEQYPDCKIKLFFNMLKYVELNKKLVERNKLDLFDLDFDDAMVEVDLTDENMKDLSKYIEETVNMITSLNKEYISDWKVNYNPRKDFFCKNLCAYKSLCIKN